jgi:hypothetical protein
MAARVVDFVVVVFGVAWVVRRCGSTNGRAGMVGAKGRAEALMRVSDLAVDLRLVAGEFGEGIAFLS